MSNKNKEKKLEQKVNIKEALKENQERMEIAKELNHSRKTISDVLGERLAKTRRFPPC
ncbi:MAG: hypothetical protein IJH34_10130 [Romboutsia sp.]|nr:hypothetical protein [Romboutsia sp.]